MMAVENLSTITLLAVVLVGSLAVFGIVMPIFNQRTVAALAVDSAEAQVSPTDAVVVINVRNAGGKQLRMVELKVQVEGCDVMDFNVDMPPGSAYTLILRNPPGRWVAGETKNAAITAVFSDGSTTATIASIRVSGTGWHGTEEEPLEEPSEDNSEGEGSGKKVIFMDDFKNGLSGWRPWGNATGLAVEVDMHGKPSPCLHVCASGQVGSLAGASKTADVNFSSPATLYFTFDYNVHALKDRGVFSGNLWVRVLGASGNVLVDEKVYEANSADSGWKNATVTIPPVTGRITLIIYAQILSSKGQDFWIDNVALGA